MFVRTTTINKILELKRFVKGVQGGTSSGKTFAILPILIDIAAKTPNTDISVVAESIPHLKRGCIKDFKKIMQDTGRWVDQRFNGTDFKYTFANNSTIEFFSADADAKLRGARRDYLYINECNNVTFNSYNELAMRTKKGIYLDWNPTNEFWFHTDLQQDENVDFIITTYLDNEACPQSAIDFILNAKKKSETSPYWDNWYKVYGLGQIGSLQGTIFNDWSIVDAIPNESEFISYGMDFGFTNDPTTLVAAYRFNGELYFKELIYQTQLTNQLICQRMRELGVKEWEEIVADCAEPKSISEIRIGGYPNTFPAKKGADSIRVSIDLLQTFKINVTNCSLNLIRELRAYRWATNSDGNATKVPIDSQNHCIDAMRYIALNKLAKGNARFVFG